MNELVVTMEFCPKCGGRLVKTVKRNYSLLDLFGVAVVGGFVLGFLVLILSLGHISKSFMLFVWVGGLVAFGLYHMIGFNEMPQRKCDQCGVIFENDITA